MQPAQLTPWEWEMLRASQRDLIRLQILNYTPPNEFLPVFETDTGWLLALAREEAAAVLEHQFNNLTSYESHKLKAFEIAEEYSAFLGQKKANDKSRCCTKKSLTSQVRRGITQLVRIMKRIRTIKIL
jgi:hypothetical protein